MSLADELLADLDDDNDDGELEQIKQEVKSEDEGNSKKYSFPLFVNFFCNF